ncbi:MAG TPA: DUF2244 domain-containing protein [Burkholderiales bacterium]
MAEFDLTARRNNSLSSAGLQRVFCLISLVVALIALGFTLAGAWPVLVFSGLELVLLCVAFRCAGLHSGDFERVVVIGDKILVDARNGAREAHYEFNRYWAQVVVSWDVSGRACRVALRSHGREVEFGRHLTDEGRLEVARELRRRVGGR